MKIEHHLYNYTDYSNLTVEFKEVSETEMQQLYPQLKSIGIDIHFKEYSNFPGLSDIIRRSLEIGTISISGDGVSFCTKCHCGGKYPLYKSGSNKGQPNYNKKKYYPHGITFNRGIVSFRNSGDYCSKCVADFDILNTVVNVILENDLSIEILIPGHTDKTRYIKDEEYKCHSCGKTMYETEMNRSDRIMDSSTYPAECPHCKALSIAFGKSHSRTGKFRMLTLKEYAEIARNVKRVSSKGNSNERCYSDVSFKNGRLW